MADNLGAVTGLALSRAFYERVIAPRVSDLPHAAALLGDGSEVLGFDDAVSPDHDFGPRAQIFVTDEQDVPGVLERLAPDRLPATFEGRPVVYVDADSHDGGARHQIQVVTPSDFFTDHLGWDPAAGVSLTDWLTTPTQRFATMAGGEVFHDPDDLLTHRRGAVRWYPDDVWRYVLAAAWLRVSQEEAFVGRTGARGDQCGSALVAARVARDLLRIAFLIERRWAPYSKWLGTAFDRLPLAAGVGPYLDAVMGSRDWRQREAALCAMGRELVVATNRLGLAVEVDPAPRQFYDRDIRVIGGQRVSHAMIAAVTDADVLALVERLGRRPHDGVPMLPGAIDQAVDSVDVLTHVDRCRAAAPMLGLQPTG